MKCKILMISLCILCATTVATAQRITDKLIWKRAEQQVAVLYANTVSKRVNQQIFPRALEGDTIRLVHSGDWTSGFFPGILWFMYEYTRQPEWKIKAENFTALMSKEPTNRNSHDVGFKVYNSYGQAYRHTLNAEYKKQLLIAAATLASRFNATTGCIRSWDFGKWQYPVIIDNMMNLELLFAATRLSGDSSYYKIAVSHANTTLKNHFRADYSSYHVVDYDTLTGKVIGKSTHQGYADESAWARGQAWALYGYTMCYRETKNINYLKQAEAVATFILNNKNLPIDHIPYWDFNSPDIPNTPRDASAAAIVASALYELKNYSTHAKEYKATADTIINTLAKTYTATPGTHQGFLLLHSTGNKPSNGEIDVPIIYGDYYYLEALMRRHNN